MQLLSTDYKFAVSFVILVVVLLFVPPDCLEEGLLMENLKINFSLLSRLSNFDHRFRSELEYSITYFEYGFDKCNYVSRCKFTVGLAGLFNVGIMGFVALGGLAAVLVSAPPVYRSWSVGGIRIITAIIFGSL